MFASFSKGYLRTEARQIVEAFVVSCPPPSKAGHKPVSEKNVARSLDALYRQAARLSQEKRLGIWGRARLARALQAELQGLGYPADLVSRVVGAVTVNSLVAATPTRG